MSDQFQDSVEQLRLGLIQVSRACGMMNVKLPELHFESADGETVRQYLLSDRLAFLATYRDRDVPGENTFLGFKFTWKNPFAYRAGITPSSPRGLQHAESAQPASDVPAR